jgi:Cof subfamily protein (haloacid dehalogenase superfamily)
MSSPSPLCATPPIKLVVSDVDGTLLNSSQNLTERVEKAIARAEAQGVQVLLATGKARGPWYELIKGRIGAGKPGVFLQGLAVYDGDGELIYQRTLEIDVICDVVSLAESANLTVTAYCGSRILAKSIDAQTDRLKFYKEPDVEAVGPLSEALKEIDTHKLIFMGDQAVIDQIRPQAEAILRGRASLTTALEGMLEVLPINASKGHGVEWLLSHLEIDAREVMALGDGENDIEMLKLVGLGVAMGQAKEVVKRAAQVTVASNDEDGVAEALEKYVTGPLM